MSCFEFALYVYGARLPAACCSYSHLRRVASQTSDASRLVSMELSSFEPGSAVGTELLKMGAGRSFSHSHIRTYIYDTM